MLLAKTPSAAPDVLNPDSIA